MSLTNNIVSYELLDFNDHIDSMQIIMKIKNYDTLIYYKNIPIQYLLNIDKNFLDNVDQNILIHLLSHSTDINNYVYDWLYYFSLRPESEKKRFTTLCTLLIRKFSFTNKDEIILWYQQYMTIKYQIHLNMDKLDDILLHDPLLIAFCTLNCETTITNLKNSNGRINDLYNRNKEKVKTLKKSKRGSIHSKTKDGDKTKSKDKNKNEHSSQLTNTDTGDETKHKHKSFPSNPSDYLLHNCNIS